MTTLTQKKFSISLDQRKFLETYKQWGFTDQSSIVREALDRYMKELKTLQRKTHMAQKANELLADYERDEEMTAFTDLDSEDII